MARLVRNNEVVQVNTNTEFLVQAVPDESYPNGFLAKLYIEEINPVPETGLGSYVVMDGDGGSTWIGTNISREVNGNIYWRIDNANPSDTHPHMWIMNDGIDDCLTKDDYFEGDTMWDIQKGDEPGTYVVKHWSNVVGYRGFHQSGFVTNFEFLTPANRIWVKCEDDTYYILVPYGGTSTGYSVYTVNSTGPDRLIGYIPGISVQDKPVLIPVSAETDSWDVASESDEGYVVRFGISYKELNVMTKNGYTMNVKDIYPNIYITVNSDPNEVDAYHQIQSGMVISRSMGGLWPSGEYVNTVSDVTYGYNYLSNSVNMYVSTNGKIWHMPEKSFPTDELHSVFVPKNTFIKFIGSDVYTTLD